MQLFVLHRSQEGEFFIVPDLEALLDGRCVKAGESVRIQGIVSLRVGESVVTIALQSARLHVRLHLSRQGGELHIHRQGLTEVVSLAVRRIQLLDALLGKDAVDDDALIGALWPSTVVRTRLDLNQIVHRTRQDLSRAGLDGEVSLIRHPGGGSTSLRLSEGCTLSGVSQGTQQTL